MIFFSIFGGCSGAYAEIYTHDNTVPQSIPTGDSYTKSNAFGFNGQSLNCTPDYENGKIIALNTGRYLLSGSASMKSGSANVVILGACFLNGEEQNQIHFQRKISTAGDVGAASFSGIVNVVEPNSDIDFRLRHSYGSDIDITIVYGNMMVSKL